MNLFSHCKISIIASDENESVNGSLLNLMNSSPIVGDSWQSYDMIYNEELIRVKLSHKTQPAHTDIGQT